MCKKMLLGVGMLVLFGSGFFWGYLFGLVTPTVEAQESMQGYDSQGNSWSSFQSVPGGETYYYGSNGQKGMYYNTTPAPYIPGKNPC